MADDITLTVRVRDMTRGDFDRLDRQLDRMRRDLRGVARDGESAGIHARRLGNDINTLQQRFQRMQTTGSVTRRELTQMRGALDAMSRSAMNASRSGEISIARFRSLDSEIRTLRAQLDYLGRDLDGNTNALRRNNNQTRTTIRLVNGMTQSVRTSTRSIDGNTRIINTWRNEADRASTAMRNVGDNGKFAGGIFSNLRAKLIGAAAVLIASLLPTIGALAPMLAGIGSVVGVAALAFSGLSKPTKQLSKDEKDFLKALKPVREEFGNLQQAARKAVLPGLAKSFGDVQRAVKSLNPVITIAGDAFTKLVDKTAKGVGSDKFMKPFTENVKIGTDWLLKFTGSFGTFLVEFFKFGAKSKPALDAWQNLLGGFLDRGLPGMFKNMESGIKGASDYLNGLANLINDGLLPGIGSLVGKFMEAFGPTLGRILTEAGRAFDEFSTHAGELMTALAPAGEFLGNLFAGFIDAGRIANSVVFDLIKNVGGALFKTFVETFSSEEVNSFGEGLNSISTWIQNNEGAIRSAFTNIAIDIITMVNTGIQMLPKLAEAMTFLATAALTAFDVIISSAAHALGWIPGIGEDLKKANEDFDAWASGVKETLEGVTAKTQEYADKAAPNLERAKLQLNVDQAKAALEDIKTKLQDPELTKERKAELNVEKQAAEQKLREAEAALNYFNHKTSQATIDANISPFAAKFGVVNSLRPRPKTVSIGANTAPFNAALGGIIGRTLGTSYINVQMRRVDENFQNKGFANGGIVKAYANGGRENHVAQIAPAGSWRVWGEPETGGEAYIPLSPTKRTRSRQIASDTVGMLGGSVQWFANGGSKDARNTLKASFGINPFGRLAGWNTTPFERSLARPSDMNALVGFINQTLGTIRAAFSGGWEKYLVRKMSDAGKALIKHQANLTKVNTALEKAKDKLDGLKQSAESLRESVSSGVLSSTSITKAATGDKVAQLSDVMAMMQQNRDKATAFSGALSTLKERGFSGEIIKQIAEAGIEGGGLETATALMNASASEIGTLNSWQAEISQAAGEAGKTAADAMYGAGIKAAEGLVKGLTAQKAAIEKAMLNIAKAMEAAIKRALGIRSPSRVMQQVGHHTAEGFAVGMAKNRNVDTAWSSMLNVKTASSGVPASSRGGGEQYVIPIYIGGKEVDEIWLDTARRIVRTRGGNVQQVLGRRTS